MRKKYLGFTIVEIMVVISIIGILATLVTINIVGAKKRSNYTKILTDMDSIADAIKLYREETGAWPVDQNRNTLPTEPTFAQYLPSWPKSPCSSIVYDYENQPQPGPGNLYVGITMKYYPSDGRLFSSSWPPDILYYYDIYNLSQWDSISVTYPTAQNVTAMTDQQIACPGQYDFGPLP